MTGTGPGEMIAVSLYGVPEFMAEMERLKPDSRTMTWIIQQALDGATQPILETMKSLCPEDTGALRASLGRKSCVLKRGRIYFTILGPRANWRPGASGLPPTRYAHLIEFGVPSRGIPAQSFIRAAWEMHRTTFPADFLTRVMILMRSL